MPRNRVQHQKGLSDDAFERLYPDEDACRRAWFAWRWPEGFKCPRCAGSTYCEIRGRQLLQCRQCRHQTSLIAGTVLQGTKLPMRVWFRAMHLLAQGKKGLSNIELGRRLGISTNAAWRVQHKLMQAMIERDRRYKLGAGGPRIEIDDVLQRVRADPVCRLLMTVPGIGALSSLAYVTTVEEPSRFARSRSVGAHLGLTPRRYQSGV
jgi:Transposase zinc-ribbon domain/Transposase IS116/IS110/IS902 family